MNYTEKELKVIKLFCFNYENAEDEKHDNASYADIRSVAEELKISVKIVCGICLSLRNKGLLFEDEVNGESIYMVSNFGIDEFYRLKNL